MSRNGGFGLITKYFVSIMNFTVISCEKKSVQSKSVFKIKLTCYCNFMHLIVYTTIRYYENEYFH